MGWKVENPDSSDREYDICLSFAGEQRSYVSEVAGELSRLGIRVFYDEDEKARLWGKDLYEHLSWVYRKSAKYCILFASDEHAEKVWTTHERRAAQARAMSESQEYILPVIFDDSEVPGLLPSVGFLDARKTTASEVADLAAKKLGPIVRKSYLPPTPDLLFKMLKLKSEGDQKRCVRVAESLLGSLKRATVDERRLVGYVFTMACAEGSLTNPHVNLDLMRRDIGIPGPEITSAISGMSSLGFFSQLKRHSFEGGGEEALYLEWHDMSVYKNAKLSSFATKSSTKVAAGMFQTALEHYCEDHLVSIIERLDFSALSSSHVHRH
ncbi:toll/interleukin-1 receptor domain-containing protein [Micromonospora avicenniae]|uniref:TIR domain-containing protein n=1 Tax=Micromonospora avicenniae TaxID=1198245 RepID=A0A1N6RAJ9_9ACTN|nr:TIR domain-containing protein [Micromonospora avicenniae]SIQ25858.1 TIR domain-containing protein [Micromonospora avicenniae]